MSQETFILLLRHGEAAFGPPGSEDADRQLTARGRRQAHEAGRRLRKEGLLPDVLWTSPAARAFDTAREAASGCQFQGSVETKDELYLAEPETYVRLLQQLPRHGLCVLIVAHNPGLSDLIERLTGVRSSLETASVAWLSLSDFLGLPVIQPASAKLRAVFSAS